MKLAVIFTRHKGIDPNEAKLIGVIRALEAFGDEASSISYNNSSSVAALHDQRQSGEVSSNSRTAIFA